MTCSRNSDCVSGSCQQIVRNNRVVSVCADNNACQEQVCDLVTCDEGFVCNPDNGDCVSCYDDSQCADGEVCLDQACVEPTGGDRDYSSWGDGDQPPSCDECTEDEECYDYNFFPNFCALPCGDGLICPDALICCRVGGVFGVPESELCIDPRNSFAGQICR